VVISNPTGFQWSQSGTFPPLALKRLQCRHSPCRPQPAAELLLEGPTYSRDRRTFLSRKRVPVSSPRSTANQDLWPICQWVSHLYTCNLEFCVTLLPGADIIRFLSSTASSRVLWTTLPRALLMFRWHRRVKMILRSALA
jgi:hypothetical protein